MRLLFVFFLFVCQWCPPVSATDRTPMRVGVYQNMPGVVIGVDGGVHGFSIDIFEYIAAREGWALHYVLGSLEEIQQWLDSGQVDLLLTSYATPKGQNTNLLKTIDPYLLRMKQDKESILYQSIESQFANADLDVFSARTKWVMVAVGGVLLFFLGSIILLIKRFKSNDLALQNEIREHEQADTKLRESYQALVTTTEELKKKTIAIEKAKSEAEIANQTKSELLTNLSHEIFTPMNTILGLSDLAIRETAPDKIHDFLARIQKSSQSLTEKVNDFLNLSQIITDRIVLDSLPFTVPDFMRILVRLNRDKVLEKGLRLTVSIWEDIPPLLRGDPEKLGQALGSLLDNAIKFTKEGWIAVDVKLEERSKYQVKLQFSVQDTGIGMTAEQTEKIFDPFYQADGSSTRKYGGIGIGLAICKRIVEKMDGQIWVESTVGMGSTFYFTTQFSIVPEMMKNQPAAPFQWVVEPDRDESTGQSACGEWIPDATHIALFRNLSHGLQSGDAATTDLLLPELTTLLSGVIDPTLVQDIRRQVCDFELLQADHTLKRIAETLGIVLVWDDGDSMCSSRQSPKIIQNFEHGKEVNRSET